MDMNSSKFLETVEDRGAWGAAVHGVIKSQTPLSKWKTAIHNLGEEIAQMLVLFAFKSEALKKWWWVDGFMNRDPEQVAFILGWFRRSVLLLILIESQSAGVCWSFLWILLFSPSPPVSCLVDIQLPENILGAWGWGWGCSEGNAGFPAMPSFSARDARYTQCPSLLSFQSVESCFLLASHFVCVCSSLPVSLLNIYSSELCFSTSCTMVQAQVCLFLSMMENVFLFVLLYYR